MSVFIHCDVCDINAAPSHMCLVHHHSASLGANALQSITNQSCLQTWKLLIDPAAYLPHRPGNVDKWSTLMRADGKPKHKFLFIFI